MDVLPLNEGTERNPQSIMLPNEDWKLRGISGAVLGRPIVSCDCSSVNLVSMTTI